MEFSSLFHDLHLSSSSETRLCSQNLPPITEFLSELQKNLSVGWAELQARYEAVVKALVEAAALPLCDDDCSSLPAAAYQSTPCRAVAVCSALSALLGSVGSIGAQTGLPLALAPTVLVFAVTHFQNHLWTDSASRAAARKLQAALLRAGRWTDCAHLLMGQHTPSAAESESSGILGKILDILQPQMTKTSWQRCEAVKFVYVWVVLQFQDLREDCPRDQDQGCWSWSWSRQEQVTSPFVSSHLPRLLPATLLLADHYRPENCILGVRCLHHLVLNTPPAELRQWNTAEVVYEALFKHLYTSDADVIQPVLWCLLDLLLVLEVPPCTPHPSWCPRKLCRHDNVLRLMLTNMEAEHKVALRRVYASALPLYVERMGVAICRHMRRLQRVVVGYLEVADPPEERSRLKVLQALQSMIRAAWPRMASRADVMLRSLLKFLLDASSDSDLDDSLKQRLMNEAAVCIKLMDCCCHGNLQSLLQKVDGSCCSADVLRCLATVTLPVSCQSD